MYRLFYLLIICFCYIPLSEAATELRSPEKVSCQGTLENALKALKKGHEPVFPDQVSCPEEYALVAWLWFRQSSTTFEEMATFLRTNPFWPELTKIREQTELSIKPSTSPSLVLEYFATYPPLTSEGALKYAEILQLKRKQAAPKIRDLWQQTNFTAADEKNFYTKFKIYLLPENHQKRLDRLMIEGNFYGLERMKAYVSKRAKSLINYVLPLLKTKKPRFRWRPLPPEADKNIGIVVRRLDWLLKGKEYDQAETLFLKSVKKGLFTPYPPLLLKYRNYFARHAFKAGNPKLAHTILSQNSIKVEEIKDIVPWVEGEWFTGWLSLRFLHNPKNARLHFIKLFDIVKTPISKAKMAYWMGETETALGKGAAAQEWYEKAADHPHTFYGQLALKKLGKDLTLSFKDKADAVSIPETEQKLLNAIEKLIPYGFEGEREILLLYLARNGDPLIKEFLVDFTHTAQLPHLAVFIAKTLGKNGPILIKNAYPTLPLCEQVKKLPHLSEPFIHTIIRQESNFNSQAISTAGAQGYMQLMPPTAQRISKRLALPFQQKYLLNDPETNILLGCHYYSGILEDFKGNLALALASYNAGPYRALEWIKIFGDPRDEKIDLVDWIESLPFEETRGYIQRILESLPLYEQRLKQS